MLYGLCFHQLCVVLLYLMKFGIYIYKYIAPCPNNSSGGEACFGQKEGGQERACTNCCYLGQNNMTVATSSSCSSLGHPMQWNIFPMMDLLKWTRFTSQNWANEQLRRVLRRKHRGTFFFVKLKLFRQTLNMIRWWLIIKPSLSEMVC